MRSETRRTSKGTHGKEGVSSELTIRLSNVTPAVVNGHAPEKAKADKL